MKVGDSVIVDNTTKGDYNNLAVDRRGFIIEITPDEENSGLEIRVELDGGSKYWFRKENLKLT